MSKSFKRTAVVGLTLGATTVVGAAFAAWTASGSGTGSATASSAKDLTFAVSAPAVAPVPGSSRAVMITVTNPNEYKVSLTSLTGGAATSAVKNGAAAAGCTASSISLTNIQALSDSNRVVAGEGTKQYTATVDMGFAAEDGCQGATFTFPVAAAGAQVQ